MTTIRKLYEEAKDTSGALDFEVLCAEEADFYNVSHVQIDVDKEEVRLS